MKLKPQDFEAARRMFLSRKVDPTLMLVNEEFRQAGFFIETMERFIKTSETDEVSKLTADAELLSEDAQDEFWQWHFPEHWESIFGARIRSSFCSQLCSQVEGVLSIVARQAQVLAKCPISLKDMKGGSILEQHRKYLQLVGGFQNPSSRMWSEIGYLFKLRNIFVHEEGYTGSDKDAEFVTFLRKLPNVHLKNGSVELHAGSCPALLNIAQQFSVAILTESGELLRRLQLIEN